MAKSMRSMNRSKGRQWWRDVNYTPKNSKWLQDNLTGVDAIVTTMINKIEEEQTDSFAKRAQMRLELMKNVEELYRAYCDLAEKYDNDIEFHDNQDEDQPRTSDEVTPSPWNLLKESIEKLENQRNNLLETESEATLSEFQIQAEKLKNVEDELAEKVEKLSNAESSIEEQRLELESLEKKVRFQEEEVQRKREEMEKVKGVSHARKLELELMEQKVKLQKEELKQKREEIEIIKPRLSELEVINSELENRVRVLTEEKEVLDEQKTQAHGKISILLQDLSSLKVKKEKLQHELAEHLSGQVQIQHDLSHQIEEAIKEREMQKEAFKKNETEREELLEKNMKLEKSLLGATMEIEALRRKVAILEDQVGAHFQTLGEVLKKNSSLKSSLSESQNGLEDSNRKLSEEEERKVETGKIIYELKKQVEILKEEIKLLNSERIKSKNEKQGFDQERIWSYVGKRELFYRNTKDNKTRSSSNSSVGALFHWLNLIKSHLAAVFCSVGTVLRFYVNFFTAHNKIEKVKEEKDKELEVEIRKEEVEIEECNNQELKSK